MHKSVTLVVVAFIALSSVAISQNTASSSNGERKVIARVAPDYPELARRMQIHGIVRLEAVVRPNGSVKSTRVLGGNPVLVDAAVAAVEKWKFEPAQTETSEIVQVAFAAQ